MVGHWAERFVTLRARSRVTFFRIGAAVNENVSARVVRGPYGAPHRSHQRIGTHFAGEDPAVLSGRQGVRHSQIPKRPEQGRPVEEDIRVTRVRSIAHSSFPFFPFAFLPVNRTGRSISA